MTWLINLVIGWGVPKGAARIVSFAMIAVVIVAILWGAKCAYDKNIIDNAFTKVEAEQAKADRDADRKAGEQRREDDARVAQENQELNDVLNEAGDDPAVRRRELFRCIRLQQAARQNGEQPPSCV